MIDEILRDGELSKKSSLTLRGRLGFCDSFIFGRLGRVALQEITRHAYARPSQKALSRRLVESLQLLKERVVTGLPRSLSCKLLSTFYLFTDASFNQLDGAGFGAVLFCGKGKVLAWFSLHVNMEMLGFFLAEGRQTIIGELETLVVSLALLLWGEIVQFPN